MELAKDKIVRLKGQRLRVLYEEVLERDEYCCHECGSHTGIEIHHIKFKSQGGSDIIDNLVTLCRVCHGKRHGIKIIEGEK